MAHKVARGYRGKTWRDVYDDMSYHDLIVAHGFFELDHDLENRKAPSQRPAEKGQGRRASRKSVLHNRS